MLTPEYKTEIFSILGTDSIWRFFSALNSADRRSRLDAFKDDDDDDEVEVRDEADRHKEEEDDLRQKCNPFRDDDSNMIKE